MRFVGAVVVALLVLGAGIALGAPEDVASQFEESDAAALSASPSSDPGVELKPKRTATSETFRLPSGALETRIHQSSINYQTDNGDWKPIDGGFEEVQGGRLSNGANAFDVSLPERLGEEAVRLSTDEDWISAELLGVQTQPAQLDEGNIATYESADGGTSFEFTSLTNGLKEEIEIVGPSQPASYRFSLTASQGIAPTLEKDGSVAFRDEAGRLVATLPAPVVSDSAPGSFPTSEFVRYQLESQVDGQWLLAVEVDPEWIASPERVWPARIDPTITLPTPNLDCMFGGKAGQNGWHACGSEGHKELRARYVQSLSASNDERTRSAIRFNLSSIPTNAYVVSATIGVHASSEAINTSGAELRRTEEAWTSDLNWRYKDFNDLWQKEGGTYSSAATVINTSERGAQAGWWVFSDPNLTSFARLWVSTPFYNRGVILKLSDDEKRECTESSCKERFINFDSSAATNTSNRPYLTLTYYPPAQDAEVTTPTEGMHSARRVALKAKGSNKEVSGVTFQVKHEGQSEFKTIPSALVRDAEGQPVTWPMPVKGSESEAIYFDAASDKEMLLDQNYGALFEVRALLEGPPGIAGYTPAVNAVYDPYVGGARDASTPVGPGVLDLASGNFTISRTDVSIPGFGSELQFARSFSSGDLISTGVLGTGWQPSVPVEAAGGAQWQSIFDYDAAEELPYVVIIDPEGYEYAFEVTEGGAYVTPPEMAGWSLVRQDSTNLVLSDPVGNRTTFQKSTSGFDYKPVSISQPGGAGNKTRMLYDYVGGKRRLNKVIAPTAPGVSCPDASATTTLGCQVLGFTYKSATTWGGSAELGDRLASITYYGPASKTTMSSWEVASYSYDTAGRLTAAWDPRISPALKETYTYVAPYYRIKTLTPPAQEPWTFEYGSAEGQQGRLVRLKRPSLLASPSVAQTTIAYEVPISGSGAPYDLSSATAAAWGQQKAAFDATAIFAPDEVPSSPPSAYTRATVYYMDGNGQIVNTATPSGAGTTAPSITTTEADEHGNVVRELSAQNRLRALAAGSSSAERSHELETKRIYSVDGIEMQQEWGPMHQVRLESGSSVQARMHTTVQHDEGWPGTGIKPHLPTKQTTGADLPKEEADADQRVTETKYNWTLRKLTETIVDPAGLKLRTRVEYDSETGLPTERRLPAEPNGGDAHTTKMIYYTAGASSDSECANTPAYAGLPCKVTPAKQPGTVGQPPLVVTKYASYSPLRSPTEVLESPGGAFTQSEQEKFDGKAPPWRQIVTTFDTAGRLATKRTEGGGTALPPQKMVYSSTTGLLVEAKFTCETKCEGFDSQAIVTAYDKLGRPVQYTDADGSTSKTTYDLLGRPATIYDGKGTQTFGYDATSGLLTKLEDTAAGTFTATYDADGAMVERGLPNGLVASTTYDEVGEPTKLAYTKVPSCTEKCIWLEESNERSIYGQILSQTSLGSSQQYSYDEAGRLTLVKDTPQGGECTTRQYFFDADSNRTKLTTRAPGAGGACDVSSKGTSQEYSYDAADRLTGEVTYDGFGRITSLPSKYAGGSTLKTSFYSNEMVASQSQAGLTNTYQLDAAGRPRQVIQAGTKTGTEIFHYAMASDSTAWTERGGTWTRSIGGIGGELAAIQESSGTTNLQLANLHGDIVAIASLSLAAKEPTANFEFDEFGNPKKATPGRYGWLGDKQRRTELPSGVIQMGVRSYVPAIGRFITTDPVLGGSANAYDYANQDPLNQFDLDGLKAKKNKRAIAKASMGFPCAFCAVRERLGNFAARAARKAWSIMKNETQKIFEMVGSKVTDYIGRVIQKVEYWEHKVEPFAVPNLQERLGCVKSGITNFVTTMRELPSPTQKAGWVAVGCLEGGLVR